MRHECFVAPEVGLGPVSGTQYLTNVAHWLKEIAENLKPCPEVDRIKRIGHSIENFKVWTETYVEETNECNIQLLADLANQIKELRSRSDALAGLIPLSTMLRQAVGKRALKFETGAIY